MNDLSEKEQLEALRNWWRDNGNYVIAGIIVGIVTIFGWNQYKSTVTSDQVAASRLFEDVMGATGRGNIDAAVSAADQLFAEHDDTAYAAQARLALARLYMDNGRDADAATVLRTVVDSKADEAIALVARLRLAKVLLYQDKAQEVVDLLEGQPDSAFSARFSEALGDAYFALGDYARAESAYVAALDDDPSAPTIDKNLVQLKINDLPSLTSMSPATPAASGAQAPAEEPVADETGAAAAEPVVDEASQAGGEAEAMPAESETVPAEPEGGEGN